MSHKFVAGCSPTLGRNLERLLFVEDFIEKGMGYRVTLIMEPKCESMIMDELKSFFCIVLLMGLCLDNVIRCRKVHPWCILVCPHSIAI